MTFCTVPCLAQCYVHQFMITNARTAVVCCEKIGLHLVFLLSRWKGRLCTLKLFYGDTNLIQCCGWPGRPGARLPVCEWPAAQRGQPPLLQAGVQARHHRSSHVPKTGQYLLLLAGVQAWHHRSKNDLYSHGTGSDPDCQNTSTMD